jgi:hypothetical protein
MKVSLVLSNNLSGFNSRDIRNFIGSIADEKDKNFVMHHNWGLSPVIYPMPYHNNFEIVFTKSDELSINIMNNLIEKLESKNISFYGEKIKKVNVNYDTYFSLDESKKGMTFYKSRTPFVLAINNTEYKILYNVVKNQDKSDFMKYLKRKIKDSILFQAKEFSSNNISLSEVLNDLEIYFQNDSEHFSFKNIQYKDKTLPVMYLSFISNYKLPEFIGYKIGLGFGHFVNIV